jgi:DNA-binding SARP family transcriptional activator/TolB-like protein
MLRLRTLGGLSIENGISTHGAAAHRRPLALLALLAVAGRKGLSRDKIVAHLWPESDADHGRNSLSQAISVLRRELGADDVLLGSTELRVNSSVLACDVIEFEERISGEDFEGAVALYTGPFLDGVFLRNAAEFERWVERERARLEHVQGDALEHLAVRATARGDHVSAARRWRQRANLAPSDSRAALRLMESLVASGDPAGALEHYRTHQALLRDELGIEPDATHAEFAAAIRGGIRRYQGVAQPARPKESGAAIATHADNIPTATAPSAASSGSPHAALPATRRPTRRTVIGTVLGVVLLSASVGLIASLRAPDREERSIAIVPIENSAEDSLDYLVEGLASSATERLSRLPGLRVIATSVMRQYEGRTRDLGALGRQVGVTALLTGRLVRERDTLRFSFEVVRSRDGTRMAGQRFVIDASRLSALESDLIDTITVALGLAAPEGKRVIAADGEASLLIWRADHFMLNRDSASLRRARDLYNAAIERDPALAAAYSGLSSAYGAFGEYGLMPASASLEASEKAARDAIRLDPWSARAIASLGNNQGVRYFRWDEALLELRRAAALEPWRAPIWNLLGTNLRKIGRFDESVAAFRRAQALDPLSRHYHRQISAAFRCGGQYDSALVAIRQALALGATYPEGHRMAAEILVKLQRYDDAISEWRIMAQQTGDSAMTRALEGARGQAGVVRFRVAYAREELRRLDALPPHISTSLTVHAGVAAAAGNIDRAFDLLEQALRERDSALSGIGCVIDFEPWRTHPRFVALMRAMNLTPSTLSVSSYSRPRADTTDRRAR